MLGDARVDATIPTVDLDRAQDFYGGTLGLRPTDRALRGREVVYDCGGGTRLLLYERKRAGTAEHRAHGLVAVHRDMTAGVRVDARPGRAQEPACLDPAGDVGQGGGERESAGAQRVPCTRNATSWSSSRPLMRRA